MSDEWYYAQQGQQQGPVPFVELRRLAKSGRLQPTDLVWRDGMASWTEAQWTRGLFTSQPDISAIPLAPVPKRETLPLAAELVSSRELSGDEEVTPRRRLPRRGKARSMGPGAWLVIFGGVVGAVLVIGIGVWAIVSLSGQATQHSWSLAQGQKADYFLRFTGSKKVELWVQSDRDTDVDLFVYDPNNQLVAWDDGDSKDCHVSFVVPVTQTYRVEVQNRVRLEPFLRHRNGPNTGTLRYQESEKGAQDPIVNAPPQPRKGLRVPLPLPRPGQPRVQRVPQVIALQPGPAGAAHQGTLTRLDGGDPQHGNAFCKIFTYPMTAGKQYVIDLQSTEFDAFLRLEDAAGQQLTEDDDGGENQNARIVFLPPRDGTYRIIATTFMPGAVGNFTLTIRP